jgi:hypothetical protein
VQLHCFDAGMVLNTWYTPHSGAETVGGAFNDMYGYAWSSAHRPYAFRHGFPTAPNEFVMQGQFTVPALAGYQGTPQHSPTSWTAVTDITQYLTFGVGQLDMFAYIRDTTHPTLHPIALISGIYNNTIADPYVCPSTGNVGWDYPGGVWFASTGICTTDVSTVRYTAGYTTRNLFSTPTFYRIHYTPANLTALINRINTSSCTPGITCPVNGYSNNPNDYVVEYMGAIAETQLCDRFDYRCATNVEDSQISMATHTYGVAAYSYYP